MSVPRIIVRDLGNNGSKDELHEVFSRYGQIRNVWIATNPPGFAYVFYCHPKDAIKAVSSTNGSFLFGTRIRVEFSPTEDKKEYTMRMGRASHGDLGSEHSLSRQRSRSPHGNRGYQPTEESPERYGNHSRGRGERRKPHPEYLRRSPPAPRHMMDNNKGQFDDRRGGGGHFDDRRGGGHFDGRDKRGGGGHFDDRRGGGSHFDDRRGSRRGGGGHFDGRRGGGGHFDDRRGGGSHFDSRRRSF
jgi:hypothetical protein